MYNLFIQYADGSRLSKDFEESDLRLLFKKGIKGVIRWATVTTPSGVHKDVTKIIRNR